MIQTLNGAASDWGELFLLVVLQNTIFLGLVLAALHMLRNAPARVKYLVALLGLLKLVLPPFMRLPSMPAVSGAASGGYTGMIPFVTEPGVTAAPATSTAGGLSVQGALLGIWGVLTIAGLILIAAASVRLAVRLRGAEKAKPGDIPDVPGIEDVTVLKTGGIAMPITVAFLPGRIYVPAAWDGWTRECRRMVLMHEMAHLRRRDGAVLILQIIARAIYFFHPLVHLLDRRISEYREMACDDATVGRDRDSGVEYSRYLVEIAESVVRCPAVCGSASALIRRKNELLKRVSYQLEEGRMRSIPRTRLIVMTAAIVLLAVSLSWYRGEASAVDQREAPAPPARPAPAERPAPPAPPAQPSMEDGSRVRPVNVLLRSDGAEIDDRKVSMDELAAALNVYGGRDPGNVWVKLICDDDVPMSEVRLFQEILTKQGISKISYVNGDGEGLPLQLPPQKALDRLAEMPGDMMIDVSVCVGGRMKVGLEKVTAGDLAEVVAGELTKQPLAVVVIHNEEKTSYGDFTKALELVKKAGAERVVVRFDCGK